MTTRNKILLTIFLAVLAVWVFGCGGQQDSPAPNTVVFAPKPVVTTAYLEDLYKTDNETFFRNRLPASPAISVDEIDPKNMATTMCDDPVTTCDVKFNLKYVAARRVADFTMLHEMCHIKVWNKEMNLGQQVEHGKLWRSCMLELDAAGAFREIIIDNYSEGM